jgi:hypothetical protein
MGTMKVPFVRLKRVLRHVSRSGRGRELLPRILPALMMGLLADAAGQIMGYAFGAGNAARRRVSFELNRYQHVTEQKRATLQENCSRMHAFGLAVAVLSDLPAFFH